MDRKDFRNPGKAYRGITLWMLNDKLEPDEIVRQLDGFANAGWGAVIGRTFNGLRTEYLSDQWMDITRRIIEGAEQLGMKVWLQAGYMPSGMPGLDPSHALRVLAMRAKDAPGVEGEEILTEEGGYAYCKRINATTLDLLNGDAVEAYLDLAYRDTWQTRFGEHFGKTIAAVWVDEPHFRPPLLPWADRLPELFREHWGYDLTEHVPSLFRPLGDYQRVRHHFWRTVTGMFLEGYFERVGNWCATHDLKFSGHLMGEDTLNNQVAFTGATMPCYEFMQLPGIDHLTMSLTWPTQKKFLLTPKQISSAASQLGQDEVLAEMYAVSSQRITFEDRKQIANWLMVLGVNYRCYHGSFYSLRGRRKRIYAPHLSYQQPWWPDNRLAADYFARLSYALRRGKTATDVLVLHPVESAFCLYDPTTMAQPHDRMAEAEDVKDLDTKLVDLCDNLLQIHRGFELGDETLIAKHGSVEGDGFRIGVMTYKAVLLPEMITIRETTLTMLEDFANAGGSIFTAGALPTRVDGEDSPALAERLGCIARPVDNCPQALRGILDAAVPPHIEIIASEGDGADVWVHARHLDDGTLYFLTNTNRETGVEGELRLRGGGALEEWCLETGEVTPVANAVGGDWTVVPLFLAPLGNRLLLQKGTPVGQVAKPVTADGDRSATCPTRRTVRLAGRGRVRRDTPNALTLDLCRFRKGDGEWSNPTPVIAVQEQLENDEYAGPLALQFSFQVETPPPSCQVVVEDAAQYDILVNGHPAAYEGLPYYLDRSFHPVDVTDLVREGENTIELSIEFSPLGKPSFGLASLFEKKEGVELESIYVIGDFAVRGTPSQNEGRPDCVRYQPDFVIARETGETTGDLIADGYPFYAGRITYTETVNLGAPRDGERLVLELPSLHAVLAKVRVNGSHASEILWPPYEVDLTGHVIDGDNDVEIELVHSLRNLLGPHHRSTGEPSQTWGTAWDCPPDRGRTSYPGEPRAEWTEDYFFVPFGTGVEPELGCGA